MTNDLQVSLLELGPPTHLRAMASAAESSGYTRFWVTEHYTPVQSAAPFVTAAVAAESTSRIRVGIAGVLLRLTTPIRALHQYRALEALFPRRIDYGVAGGYVSHAPLAVGLTGSASEISYYEQVENFTGLVRATDLAAIGLPGVTAGPHVMSTGVESLWICGASQRSAELAGRLGASYAFHHELHRAQSEHSSGVDIVDSYRQSFRSSGGIVSPVANVAFFGHCADTEPAAAAALRDRFSGAGSGDELGISFMGTPGSCQEQLNELAEEYGVDEVVVGMSVRSFEQRVAAVELLGAAIRG